MVNVFVNNIKVTVEPNTSVLKACEALKIEIPRFCYHKKLSIAGNCRMCLVEIEKSPKPVVSCAMPVMENMRIFTDTPLVKKSREGVLEFLLLNHPLDCPVCDQGGECDLQDQAMAFGTDQTRFYDLKRGVHDKKLGPLIKTIMTRCIHCTRCVRFATEIAGVEDLGTTIRGTETEIGTYIEKIFKSELSGNVIDLCPVGALTSKPYAFKARPWELKTEICVDTSDGLVSDVKLDFKSNEIVRIAPNYPNHVDYNENYNLNIEEHPFVDEWISDKARFSYDGMQNVDQSSTSWLSKSLNDVEKKLKTIQKVSNFSSLELSQESVFLPFLISEESDLYLRNAGISSIVSISPSNIINTNKNVTFFVDDDMDYNTLVFQNLVNSKLKSKLKNLTLCHFERVHFNGINIEIVASLIELPSLNVVSMDESFIKYPNNQEKALASLDFMVSRQRTNVSMSELEKSDLCLLIGTNPRYEGSLYNIHLRKRLLKGGFKMASIGSAVDLTYPISHLGLGTQTLQDLAERNHPFFEEMLKAKNPMILLGSSLLSKKDYALIEGLSLDLGIKTGVIPTSTNTNNNWLGFGILQSKPNKLGEIALGLKSINELNYTKDSFGINFILSGNEYKFKSLIKRFKSSKKTSEVSDMLIPVSIKPYLERKNFSFLSTEGHFKNFKKISNFSVDNKIFIDPIKLILLVEKFIVSNSEMRYLSSYVTINSKKFIVSNTLSSSLAATNTWIKNHYLQCFPGNLLPKSNILNKSNLNKRNCSYLWSDSLSRNMSYNSLIEDFYLTDTIRRSSLRMLRCSSLHRNRTTNFFK